MRDFLRTLPEQSLSARRRFVVLATAFSFALIILVWVGILVTANRRSAELRARVAQPTPLTVAPPAAVPVQPPPPAEAAPTEEPTVLLPIEGAAGAAAAFFRGGER